jgi:hypothetical protein
MDPPVADDDAVAPWIKDGGRNRWRYKTWTDEQFVEIELTQNKVAEIETPRLDEVQTLKWHAHCDKTNTIPVWYACSKFEGRNIRMHTFLFPDIPAPIDHIDGNGLNNITSNVRNGQNGINARNRVHSIDVGVYTIDDRQQHLASWCELNGNQQHRYFKWVDYGIDGAYIAAKACREENEARVRAEIFALQAASPGGIAHIEKKKSRATQSSNTGVKHLRFRKRHNRRERLIAYITINHEIYTTSWTVCDFPTREDAIAAGVAWISETKAQHPKASNKKRKVYGAVE